MQNMKSFFCACYPVGRSRGELSMQDDDDLLWSKDPQIPDISHRADSSSSIGEPTDSLCSSPVPISFVSMAIVQANEMLEDQIQVKTGPFGTFVGVYDGHGGPEAARFITMHLFPKIEVFAQKLGGISSKVLKKALSDIEADFLGLVEDNWKLVPQIASVGSCCIVGAICEDNIFIANLGDSRVVLGRQPSMIQGSIVAERLTEDHNAANAEVREQLMAQHPDDAHIVVLREGVWRVKGIIQVSRAIGDAYLKKEDVARDPLFSRHPLLVPFKKPALSAEPAIIERSLSPCDRFLIFASDGLWEQLTDQEAVDIVSKSPRHDVARRLVKAAVQAAAKKREVKLSELLKLDAGVRRLYHDDISVVVVYLDQRLSSSTTIGTHICRGSQRVAGLTSVDSTIINGPADIASSEYRKDIATAKACSSNSVYH